MLKNLQIKLLTACYALAIIIIVGCFFNFSSFGKMAKALSSNYNKTNGSQLTISDWNNLPADFVARTGGAASAMQGALDMGNNKISNLGNATVDSDAVTRGAMNTAISSAIAGIGNMKDTSGNNLRMVCGESSPASWTVYNVDEVTTYVNTSSAGFTSTPSYIACLYGTAGHWRTTGGSSIYESSPTGFRVYIDDYNPEVITPAQAQLWGWRIRWCAVGQ